MRTLTLILLNTAVGMRSFHVDGLAAFWAHYNIFNTYSSKQQPSSSNNSRTTPSLTGALHDKLRGLSASLEIAHLSSPCILHIVGMDRELSPTEGHAADVDARREEERRMLEAIRSEERRLLSSVGLLHSSLLTDDAIMDTTTPDVAGNISGRIAQNTFLSQSTTPQIIVVLSTSNPLPPGPISSSLLQCSIAISAPDVNYARTLWDNDVDGTFESLSSHLLGSSARDIRYLRDKFAPRWKMEMANTNGITDHTSIEDTKQSGPSPADVLQSLLPDLEIVRSFTQSSGKGGGSSNLPLSSSSLPNVRWEDIGGLESIRKEIMDAVELPLKYPELFEGSRRSGVSGPIFYFRSRL